MCGIHLRVFYSEDDADADADDDDDDCHHDRRRGSAAAAEEEEPPPPPEEEEEDWLVRRGPDHTGSHSQDSFVAALTDDDPAADGENEDGRTRRRRRRRKIRVVLQVSVLQMRDELIAQPVRLRGGRGRRSSVSGTTDDGDDTTKINNIAAGGGASSYYHLAWNGEVYQFLKGATSSSRTAPPAAAAAAAASLQDAWHFDQADTRLVAQLFEEALLQGDDDVDEDDGSSSATGGRGRRSAVLRRITRAVSSLVDAEFAFCLLGPPSSSLVYYGRDGLGRRSLLVSESDYGDRDSHEYNNELQQKMKWQLSSVANNNSSSTASSSWKEVEPRRVYCYNYATGETVSVALDPPPGSVFSPAAGTSPIEEAAAAMEGLSSPMVKASHQLEALLLEALRRRIGTTSHYRRRHHSGVSVLFSGGVDSVVLAALALKLLDSSENDDNDPPPPPLTLINVSFVDREGGGDSVATATVAADTKAALASYDELVALFPRRSIRLIQRQVDWSEVQDSERRIRRLMYPKTSTMDLNISTALWFAASATAETTVVNDDDQIDEPRILITGLGADEQMGGYGRHRKAWERGGDAALRNELDLDLNRLWERNLGRDDRVLSDPSKEARFPFLDAHVVRFLAELPLDCVCDFSLPPGEGDKRVLRLVAERLGLHSAGRAVKRAIQFGSRVAHVSDRRRFGSRRKATGEADAAAAVVGPAATVQEKRGKDDQPTS